MKNGKTTPAVATETLQDAVGAFQTLSVDVLAAIARGEIDALALVAKELAGRGLNLHGEWVGFNASAAIHGAAIAKQPRLATTNPR